MKKVSMFLVGIVTMLGLPMMVNAETIEVDSDLADAITSAEENDTIKLTGGITVDSQITVDKALTIDLNGNTITANADVKYVFDFNGNGKNFTITDSSANAGSIINTAQRGVLVTDGTLTIDKVTINSADRTVQINPVDSTDKAKAIINGGVIESNGSRTIMLWGNNVKEAAALEVNGGKIIAPVSVKNSAAINLGSANAAGTYVVVNNGEISAYNGIRLYGNGEEGMTVLTMNGGSINAVGSGIIQSTDDGTENTTIAIYGGSITAQPQEGAAAVGGDSVGIYHGQTGTLIIGREDGTGPTILGQTGISIKEGNITINGGTIKANGEYREVVAARDDGTDDTGAAISITSSAVYADGTSITVNGGTIESENGNAFYEGIGVDGLGNPVADESTVTALAITGGSFTSKEASVVTTETEEKFITGGEFSSDVSSYVSDDLTMEQDENGNYVIVSPVTDVPTEETPTEEVENPETSDGIALYFIVTTIAVLGVALTALRLRSRLRKSY